MNFVESLKADAETLRDRVDALESGSFESFPDRRQLTPEELKDLVADYNALVSRIEAQITRIETKHERSN